METAQFEVVQREGRRDTRGRRIESEKEKARLLEQYDGSGLTQKAFAQREGINYHTFVSWLQQRRMRDWSDRSKSGTLFLTSQGESFCRDRLTQMVRDYIEAADIGKHGACHLFRHACATLMLENGANIRFIQQMLGQAQLETTQIYTHLSIRQLQAVRELTHTAKMHSESAKEIQAELDDLKEEGFDRLSPEESGS